VAAVAAVKQDYERASGLQFVEVAGGYQIVTRPELHEWVRRLFHERTSHKLSVAALETLAVIAYKQPVTAPEIAEIRGVNTSGVLGTLADRKLIKIVGRKQVVGRPFMYGTTREFLERFGLNDVSDLPKVEDLSALLGFDLPGGIGEPEPQTALPFEMAEMTEVAEVTEVSDTGEMSKVSEMSELKNRRSSASSDSSVDDEDEDDPSR